MGSWETCVVVRPSLSSNPDIQMWKQRPRWVIDPSRVSRRPHGNKSELEALLGFYIWENQDPQKMGEVDSRK